LNWTVNWDGSGNKTVIVQKNAYSGQKITNPEFESTTGGWTYTSSARTAGAGRSGDATDYGWLSTSASGLCTQTVGATAGVRYLLLANLGAKRGSSNNATVTLNMNWKNSGGTTISTTTTSYTSTSTSLTWAYKELIATAPVGTTQVQIELDAGGTFTGGGQVNADNIYMVEQTAPFGISWTPDNSSTYAPQEWSEPVQAEQPINKVYIYGDTTAARGWYYNYASYAYFGRWFEGYESDTEIKTQSQAEERSRKIFSEHAFPRVEGSYTIQKHGLVAGQNQIIENAITQQNAVFTIVGIDERPLGAGEVEYKVSYGAHPRNRYTQIITAMSGTTPTSNPTSAAPAAKNSPAVSAPMMTQSVGWATVSAASVAATSGVSDVPNVETLAPQNRQPLVVQRTAGQTDANALAAATLPYEELPAGRMTLVVPETGITTQPVLYRVDSTGAAWETVTPTDLRATAIANGTLSQGMIVADSIVAGTIDASVIDVENLNATNITTGTLTSIAIQSGTAPNYRFTVDALGNATANALTIGATTSDTVGSDTTGRIAIVPSSTQSAASFQVQTDTAGNLYASANILSTTAGSSSSDATVTTEAAHGFVAGQFVSFHSTGNTTWDAITAAVPVQIKATPLTTTFTIRPHVALSALASNNAGTVRAYKRLNVVAPGGMFVYQSGTTPGVLGSGSLVLGSSLTTLGQGSLATISDGEMAFLTALDSSTTAKTPRYGSGANLYSRTGSTDVSTSGDFILGTSSTSTQGDVRFKTGTGGRIGAFSTTSGNTSIGVYNSDRSAYTALVALGFYPNQGSSNLSHNGSTFTMNDSVAVTGSITATTNITATGTIDGSNQASYVRADVSSSSTTSIPAGSFQSHSLAWTSTGSAPYVVASPFMTGASTVSMTAVVFSQTNTAATVYLYNTSSAATTVGRRAQGIAVVP